jgi:hypothetical protein
VRKPLAGCCPGHQTKTRTYITYTYKHKHTFGIRWFQTKTLSNAAVHATYTVTVLYIYVRYCALFPREGWRGCSLFLPVDTSIAPRRSDISLTSTELLGGLQSLFPQPGSRSHVLLRPGQNFKSEIPSPPTPLPPPDRHPHTEINVTHSRRQTDSVRRFFVFFVYFYL